MARRVTRKKSKKSLQSKISKLKKAKAKALKRAKELEEIRELEREVRSLEGVGTKRRIAGEVTRRMGATAGKFGWRGIKFVGGVVKRRLEAEAREQARDAARARSIPKTKTKGRKRRK